MEKERIEGKKEKGNLRERDRERENGREKYLQIRYLNTVQTKIRREGNYELKYSRA